ncbi:hypothetical protein BDV95DRAFT_623989 [Massariosphaeria phaeospora]|uniref:Uncharacterized protein n=1 Tax=Massariosphaeria phaeospora TaxID=100035 RepID=A0A7C8I4R7_9PLEO|nr:hypothetical protein BDV95DRAFT_623989 [Massariosphaeria phaeospora]
MDGPTEEMDLSALADGIRKRIDLSADELQPSSASKEQEIAVLPADEKPEANLLSLPRELRDIIYWKLFWLDSPVVLDSHHHTSQALHGLGSKMGFLRSCRVVHDEASSALYSWNTFYFPVSRIEDIHSAGRWVTRIGSSFRYLKKLEIDLDGLCSCTTVNHSTIDSRFPSLKELATDLDRLRTTMNRSTMYRPDFLPFMRADWAYPAASQAITFTHKGARLRCNPEDVLNDLRCNTEDVLNNLLVTLGRNDALDLKRYARFRDMVKNVKIPFGPNHLNRGEVIYGSSNPGGDRTISFLVTNLGGRAQMMTRFGPLRFPQLGQHVLEQIFGCVDFPWQRMVMENMYLY